MADPGPDKDFALDPETLAILAGSICDQDVSAERKASIKARIQARLNAAAPEGTLTVRTGEGRWRPMAPGIEFKILHLDRKQGTQTSLLRLAPGAVLAEHEHALDEECLVLEGEIHLGDHYVRAGDYHLAKAGFSHAPLETSSGALVLIRGEMHETLAGHPG